ncbi:ferrous iron transport protein A [bacterium]|nr:ferrous iron transport protein A [bacterium]
MNSVGSAAGSVRPLDLCRRGDQVRVLKIGGGWGIRQRLNQMGIHEGDPLVVRCSALLGGPRLIEIHGTDVALSRCMARHILVETAPK